MTVIAVNAMILGHGKLSGIGHYIVRLVTHFACFNKSCGSPHRLIALCRSEATHHLASIAGLEVIAVRAGGGRIARVLTEQLRLPWFLRREKADVLFNPAFTGPLWGATKIVTTVHDMYFRILPELVPRAQRLFLSAMTPLSCQRSRWVITPSTCTRSDLVTHYPQFHEKVSVIPLANRISQAQSPAATTGVPATPFVLLVAALTRNKNPEPLVAAISSLRRDHPKLTLYHIGTDPERQLAHAVALHGGSRWVSSRSGVSDGELAGAYQQCLCLVIPSLYEGFGLPLLEAQALGAPVISSDRGSLPEVGGNGAIYVDPTQADQIADAIHTLIISPMQRQALREDGFTNQARFSWERTAQLTWDLLLNDTGAKPS